ncbi:succinate dehydrogenase cytochrome B558 [Acetonema longum]|uniref:Succinate dehydrogenase, cytochrome b558 subunit n=1 Tax=Acetonema longum DSM 6540 TaxID=1009370 RepID=F7NKI0_9FIRM|nr:succinate dehydrogenase cytochrome B558 [Acetonema longum]EGO63432.1 succinate dehydrogenase, cytochrome b558 subunit [Acetonema longum DSM 6540]
MNQTDFYLRRLHSLTGIVPVGFFLLEHIFTISRRIAGSAAFDAAVDFLQNMPMKAGLEIGFIALPLLFHGIYGLYAAFAAKNNVATYGYFRNWTFYMQRITAYIAFLFIIWHVWLLRLGGAGLGAVTNAKTLSTVLQDPIVFSLHMIGYIATVFHFTNGIWAFLITWGITTGSRAQLTSQYLCWGLFVLLNIVGLTAMMYF